MARNDHNTQAFAAEHSGYARDDEAVTFWERSRRRAQADRGSWDYGQSPTSSPKRKSVAHPAGIFFASVVLRSGLAGGVAGCVVSLDRNPT
jgi:hypothetical protein